MLEKKLVAVSSPAVHARFHCPEQAQIMADLLFCKMKEVASNLLAPVGRFHQAGRMLILMS